MEGDKLALPINKLLQTGWV